MDQDRLLSNGEDPPDQAHRDIQILFNSYNYYKF